MDLKVSIDAICSYFSEVDLFRWNRNGPVERPCRGNDIKLDQRRSMDLKVSIDAICSYFAEVDSLRWNRNGPVERLYRERH